MDQQLGIKFNESQHVFRGAFYQEHGLQEHGLQEHSLQEPSEPSEVFSNNWWLQNDLVELVSQRWGAQELEYVTPLLRATTSNNKKALFIAPPYFSIAPHLISSGVDIRNIDVISSDCECNEAVTAIEEAIQDDGYALLICWIDWIPNSVVKRMKALLAARGVDNRNVIILFRHHEQQNSPVETRIHI